MKTITCKVSGMMCEHCENRVNNALSQTNGIIKVKADAKANEVVCDYDETQITIEAIKEIIEDVGYDVMD